MNLRPLRLMGLYRRQVINENRWRALESGIMKLQFPTTPLDTDRAIKLPGGSTAQPLGKSRKPNLPQNLKLLLSERNCPKRRK